MAVQKSAAKRGRPRAYDPDVALARAMSVFWDAGYAATSLDDLRAATGMNRPSIYAAFGDKLALYRTLLDRYRETARSGMAQALAPEVPLREALARVYKAALALYLPRKADARGCFLIGTAVTEAARNAAVRASLAAGLKEIDAAFETRIRLAVDRGELPRRANAPARAKMASAALYSLAIHSRAGASRTELDAIVNAALDLICG